MRQQFRFQLADSDACANVLCPSGNAGSRGWRCIFEVPDEWDATRVSTSPGPVSSTVLQLPSNRYAIMERHLDFGGDIVLVGRIRIAPGWPDVG
jgi:hypothetical protein